MLTPVPTLTGRLVGSTVPIPTPRQRIVMLVDGEKDPIQVDEWGRIDAVTPFQP
jgi:hypothetical protein